MNWPKSKYVLFLEGEIERLRNENRVLLSALLERTVSREAGLMLRKPGEVEMGHKDMVDRARVHYEAREKAEKPAAQQIPDLRHWRSTRSDMEAKSAAEVAAANSNDSNTRVEAKVKAAQGA